jgi:hypothetical protein
MAIDMLIVAFLAGFVIGELVGERRWKRSAYEALELAAKAIAQLRGHRAHRPK